MKRTSLRIASLAVSVAGVALLAACADEPAQYPEQQYPQQQYPQQQYPQQQYPQQQYPQQPAAQQPAQPGYTPAPAQPAPAATAGTPTAIPGLEKMPDGTCKFTPPSLTPDQPAAPMVVPCPPGL